MKALPENVRIAAARVDSRLPGGVRAVHVVKRGDTLSGVAQKHNMGLSTLARINGISATSTLRVGQRLRLSAAASVAAGNATGGVVTQRGPMPMGARSPMWCAVATRSPASPRR